MKKFLICPFVLPLALQLLSVSVAEARETSVIGGVGVGYDFWERTYDNTDEEIDGTTGDDSSGDRRQLGVWPRITVESLGIHDSITFDYAPVFTYNDLDETTDLDHYLTLDGQYSLQRNWNIWLNNSFTLSDDPGRYTTPFYSSTGTSQSEVTETADQETQTAEPTSTDEITRDLGRRRYWTNDLSLGTGYTYAENSVITIGYANRIIRNVNSDDDTNGYDESDRHDILAGLSYQFTPAWTVDTEFHYIQGLFEDPQASILPPDENQSPEIVEESQDLTEYNARVRMDHTRSVRDSIPAVYTFVGTEYDAESRQDSWAHELTLGWDHAFDQQTHLIIGAGPSYVNSEDLEGEWGYNFYARFTKAYQHSNLTIYADKSYDTRNFTGSTTDSGLADTTSAGVDFSYLFTQNLTTNLFARYQHILTVDPQGANYLANTDLEGALNETSVGDITSTRQTYSAGASLDYTFLRWYLATIRYEYYKNTGDLPSDEYNDHRISLLLSFNYNLWP